LFQHYILRVDKKIIIRVSASFEEGEQLFTWLKRYAKSWDDHFLYWDEFAFTTEALPECDGILVFNNPSEKIETNCFSENVIAFMMEPGINSEHPWMFRGLQKYNAVYSPLKNSPNSILSPGFLGWHVLQNWDELSSLPMPGNKTGISCIASNLTKLQGHRNRLDFIRLLKKEIPAVDFFGRGSNFIADKMDGLLPYRFSIALENTAIPYYFTEKITDCFLAYTIPVYYGCKNLADYFPERSFIQIDIEEPARTIEQIRQIAENDDWQQRIPALQEARQLVLNKYQPLAGSASILRNTHPSAKRKLTLTPVPDSLKVKLRKLLGRQA